MLELTLPTMTCDHCVKTVTETVRRVDAGASLRIDLPSHTVQIESVLPAEVFKNALDEQGYSAA